MGIESVLAEMGYRPKGSNSGNFMNKIGQFIQYQQIEQEKELKKKKDLFDMYKTLRSSGYDSKTAWEATLKDTGAPMPTGEDITVEKERAELDETKARTAYYNKKASEENTDLASTLKEAQIEKTKAQTEKIKTPGKQKAAERIKEKIANGETLTTGEQKLYDEIIKPKGSDLDSVFGDTDAATYVPMIKPDGTPTRVHKDDVAKALQKGYKRR